MWCMFLRYVEMISYGVYALCSSDFVRYDVYSLACWSAAFFLYRYVVYTPRYVGVTLYVSLCWSDLL